MTPRIILSLTVIAVINVAFVILHVCWSLYIAGLPVRHYWWTGPLHTVMACVAVAALLLVWAIAGQGQSSRRWATCLLLLCFFQSAVSLWWAWFDTSIAAPAQFILLHEGIVVAGAIAGTLQIQVLFRGRFWHGEDAV